MRARSTWSYQRRAKAENRGLSLGFEYGLFIWFYFILVIDSHITKKFHRRFSYYYVAKSPFQKQLNIRILCDFW